MHLKTDRLIDEYSLEMIPPACHPGAAIWKAEVSFKVDISEVLPYLNAELEDTNYNHKAKTLLWDSGEGFRCAFRPNEIAIAPIENRDVAQKLCDEIIGMVCNTWNRRHEIEPDYTGRRPPPNMLQLLKLLPGTNCKDCGCPTCMAFAAGLIKRETELSGCPHLSEDEFAENRKSLLSLLE